MLITPRITPILIYGVAILVEFRFGPVRTVRQVCMEAAPRCEWYPMAVLTVIPICCHIPRDGVVVFLVLYCIAGMLVCSVEPKRKKEKIDIGAKTGSEFFMGMRIKIDMD